ncbi:MAG: sodium:proton antiporter [Synergistaceae bacterium]|nr:sodium:proton antiporter [Synergistaceae bacterium]
MDFILSCAIFLSALVWSISYGVHILFPLALGLFCFSGLGIYRGFSAKSVLKMVGEGMSNVLVVMRIFTLIGMLTAVWRACGTIPFFVYYGISLIDGRFFILFAFIMSCFISLLLGSSLGTAATIGIVLMIIAGSGGADISMTAGAIVAGIYFGDRCAPTSASANLTAVLTKTDILDNVKNMFRSALTPFIISSVIYLALSVYSGMDKTDTRLLSEISANFSIGVVTAIPALVIIILSILRYNVLVSISVSILSGIAIAVFAQGTGLYEILKYLLTGYELEAPGQFAAIISGGGVTSMLSAMCIILISSGYSGIFEGTGVLKDVIGFLVLLSRKMAVYPVTLLTAFITAAFGCNQSISVIMTHHLMRGIYKENGLNDSAFALDIEDSSIVVAPLIPWNIAVSVPMMMFSAGASCIPYAAFLYILPIYRIFYDHPKQRRQQ